MTKTIAEIDKEIAELQNQLENVEGTKTEVYTRIVGYYRSVANWNKGKREEYTFRKLFSEPSDMIKHGTGGPADEAELTASPASYLFFYKKNCPNCPPVKEYVASLPINGRLIDVDTAEGMEQAIQHQVLASPTVIVFDVQDHEIFRAHNIDTLEKVYSTAEVGIV